MPKTNSIVPSELLPDDTVHRLKTPNNRYGSSIVNKHASRSKVAILASDSTRFRCLRLASRSPLRLPSRNMQHCRKYFKPEFKLNYAVNIMIYKYCQYILVVSIELTKSKAACNRIGRRPDQNWTLKPRFRLTRIIPIHFQSMRTAARPITSPASIRSCRSFASSSGRISVTIGQTSPAATSDKASTTSLCVT